MWKQESFKNYDLINVSGDLRYHSSATPWIGSEKQKAELVCWTSAH